MQAEIDRVTGELNEAERKIREAEREQLPTIAEADKNLKERLHELMAIQAAHGEVLALYDNIFPWLQNHWSVDFTLILSARTSPWSSPNG